MRIAHWLSAITALILMLPARHLFAWRGHGILKKSW
jgi:hypothetical protein